MDLLIDKFQATLEEQAAVTARNDEAWDSNLRIRKLFSKLKKQLTILGEMKNTIPYSEEDFVEVLYMPAKKTKQFRKVCAKWKEKPTGNCATEAQARTYLKEAYEIYDAERDSLHEMRVANNVVMQEKIDTLTGNNAQMKLVMVENQAKNEKYGQVIKIAMSMTQAPTEKTDDMTLDTQRWSA